MVIPSVSAVVDSMFFLKFINLRMLSNLIISNHYQFSHFCLQSLAHLNSYNLYTVKNSYDFVGKPTHTSPSNFTALKLR